MTVRAPRTVAGSLEIPARTLAHPVPYTLAAIRASGARVWRTDERGTITVRF
jgi:hypothetical protein